MQNLRLTTNQLHSLINECVNKCLITEAFKSDTIRQFFNNHGGVSTEYRQFSAGDFTDDQIGYAKEFANANDAYRYQWQLKQSDRRGMRSEDDMKYFFNVFVAKDGSALLVGVERNQVETLPTWGGEAEKKVANRLRSNGWNFKTRDNRYVDDSDTYYYQSPANDFGLHTSDNYKDKLSDLEQVKKGHTPEEYQNYRTNRLKQMRDYLNKYYPNLRKPQSISK